MGICGSKDAHIGKRKQEVNSVPADTESLRGATLPTLTFYVLVSDIKIKKCSYVEPPQWQDFVSLHLKIQNLHEQDLPLREMDRMQKAYWKVNHAFDFMMTEYDLRRKFAVIEVRNRKKEVLGSLKFNLFTLWTGPYHLDFKLVLPNSPQCRLSLNFKISQGISLSMRTLRAQLLPLENKGLQQRFTMSAQAIIGQQVEPAPYAYHLCVVDKSGPAPRDQYETQFVDKLSLVWEESKGKDLPLPSFQRKIAFYEIYASSLHFTFWQVRGGADPRYEMDCECFISLNKLMAVDPTLRRDPVSSITFQDRHIELEEKVWMRGQTTGKVKLSLSFSIQSHLKQMQACVRTEDGILTSSAVFNQSRFKECEEISALKQLNEQVQREFIALDQRAQKEKINRIRDLLSAQLALLEKSSKESLLFYQYGGQADLLQAQRFLIDLGFKIITYLHEQQAQIQELSWAVLTALLKRGEFKLSHLGFALNEKQTLGGDKLSEELQMKVEVGLKYQLLLNSLLRETLASLESTGDEAERIFAESFCAYAYFRIPLLRQHILAVVKRPDDPEIPEWRGTEFNLSGQNSQSETADDFYDNMFDWDTHFWQCLATQEKAKTHLQELKSILADERWKRRLARRRGAFYTFLENLVREIEYVCVVSKHIRWHRLPGYVRLLHAFLVELRTLKVKDYQDRFRNCCVTLLANQKLINVLVVVLLKKTNLHEPDTVALTFQLLGALFRAVKERQRPIPGTFDYGFLLQGMRGVLESELQYCISQVLVLIYEHSGTWAQQFSLQLLLYLLSKHFFGFYFHWSYNLRHVFHVLVYSSLATLDAADKSPSNDYIASLKSTIVRRYEHLLQLIKDQIEPTAPQDNRDRFYEKDLYRKMKHKIAQKRRPELTFSRSTSPTKTPLKSKDNAPPLQLNSTKSISSRSVGKKLLYFSQQDMMVQQISDEGLSYVRVALIEYSNVVADLKKNLAIDPHYHPQVRVKKVLDEKEIKPSTIDEW